MIPLDKLKQFFSRRRSAYVTTFRGPEATIVLADLAKFCRANETVFHPEQRVTDALIGRNEVWLRIQQHLKLSDDELLEIYTGEKRRPGPRIVASED